MNDFLLNAVSSIASPYAPSSFAFEAQMIVLESPTTSRTLPLRISIIPFDCILLLWISWV